MYFNIKMPMKNTSVVKFTIDNWHRKQYSTLLLKNPIENVNRKINPNYYYDQLHQPSSINIINFNKNRNYKHNIFTLGNGGGGGDNGSQLMKLFSKNFRLLQLCNFHSSSTYYYQTKRTMNQMLSYVTDSRGSKNSTDYRIYFRKYFIS